MIISVTWDFIWARALLSCSFESVLKERAKIVEEVWGKSRISSSRPSRARSVVMVAIRYKPVPQARPIAAVTHKPAAVVSPRTLLRWSIIVPAPKKPIPDTTCAATLEESLSPSGKPN